MAASYFPRNLSSLSVWLNNYIANLPAQAKALSINPAELKPSLDGAKNLAAAIQSDENQYAAWQAMVAQTAALKLETLTEIQRVIDRLRATPGFTEEHAKALMAVPPRSQEVQVEEHKPSLRANFAGGKVRLRWTRGKLDGINVYGRKQGEQTWQLLGRDTRPPFDDSRPLPPSTSAEVREYRAIGVLNDEEIGQPSDIISIAVTG